MNLKSTLAAVAAISGYGGLSPTYPTRFVGVVRNNGGRKVGHSNATFRRAAAKKRNRARSAA